jgi:uncharacterized protein YndB with AHSA1/START domain
MKITHSVWIERRPEDVFPWVADPELARRWQPDVKEDEILYQSPDVVGTRFREVLDQGGGDLHMTGEITGYEQDRSVTFHIESRVHDFDVQYSVQGEGGRCLFRMESTIRWKFPMNLLALVFGRRIRQGVLDQTRSEFATLKQLCEVGHGEPPPEAP